MTEPAPSDELLETTRAHELIALHSAVTSSSQSPKHQSPPRIFPLTKRRRASTLEDHVQRPRLDLDALINEKMRDETHPQWLAFIRAHPILVTLAAIALAPFAILPGAAISTLIFFIGAISLVLAPVTILPAAVLGAFFWACYAAARWIHGTVLEGSVGSENRVMMRPQAAAMGNEAHGNLEINLVKVQQKEGGGGQPEQKS